MSRVVPEINLIPIRQGMSGANSLWTRFAPGLKYLASLTLLLSGIGGILIVLSKGLLEGYQVDLSGKPVLIIAVGLALAISAVLSTPLGRHLTHSWGIPYDAAEQDFAKFLLISVELGLLVLVIRLFELENAAFYENIAILTLCGFIVHHFLPVKYRLPFFVALSLIGIVSVAGVASGAWIVGLGLALIGICRLPIALRYRIALLLAFGAAFGLLRANVVPAPWSVAVFPILASLFMFRIVVYLYELRHAKTPPSLTETFAYFFLLPNVAFPLFPVVDFSTLRRTYYNSEQYAIYQRGLRRMLRGTIYLIVYRFIYYYLVIAPTDVTNAGGLLQYLVTNYWLYIRIVGQFDVIVGILLLFGFNLPETNIFNFFASSFSDLWRRTNIYWKDFMLQVFYYPSFFRLRKWGWALALVLATLFVFGATWLLHAYQWFWILGSFPLTATDTTFWWLFGAFMVLSVLYENRAGRRRTPVAGRGNWKELVVRVLKIVGMFSLMCAMWSLWTSSSFGAWLSMWSLARVIPPLDIKMIVQAVGIFAVLFVIYVAAGVDWNWGDPTRSTRAFFRSAGFTGAFIAIVYVLANPFVGVHLGKTYAIGLLDMERNRLNQSDTKSLTQGYYENILSVNRANSQLWEVYMQQPANWAESPTERAMRLRDTGDFLEQELRPSISILVHDMPFHTNSWGMRGDDYAQQKPANTYRIALLGPSYVLGLGVSNDQTFQNLLEKRLNSSGSPAKYQVMNFAVDGYTILQDLVTLERKTLQFQPDAVFLFANPRDGDLTIQHLADDMRNGVKLPFPNLEDLAARAGVKQGMTREEAERRLSPFRGEITDWAYRRFAFDARQRGVIPAWVYLTMPGPNSQEKDTVDSLHLAQGAGFVTLDMSDVYKGQDPATLMVAAFDEHPNAQGHALIANRLYEMLHDPKIASELNLSMDSGSAPTSAQKQSNSQ